MGLFSNKEMEAKIQEIDVMKHQIMDLRDQLNGVREEGESLCKGINDIHQALNILDGDITDVKESFQGKARVFEQRIRYLEAMVNDLKLLGRLAIENREEIDTIMNILKKIAEPEFKEVFIAHDSEIDRFRRIEDEIDELKEKEIVVEGRARREA